MTHTNADARAAANTLVALINEQCERVEIAGSIRRGKAEVKDAELVVIPRTGLWPLLDTLVKQGVVDKARYGDKGTTRWGDKYRGVLVDGVKVEIFAADAVNWGYQLWLRTGPGDANTHVMKWRSFTQRTATWEAKDGYIHDAASSARLIVPDEATMFAILGTAYIPPHERTLALYETIFKRGHVWGDVSTIARADAKALPTVAPKYPVSSEKPYSPLYAVGEVVTFDGVRYAVERVTCHMRTGAVKTGQPLEYLLKQVGTDARVYVWEYQVTPVAPSAPVAALVPEKAEPLLLPSCDLRPLRDAVTEILAAHPPTDSVFTSTMDNPWAVSLGGGRWGGQWIVWQADGVVIYEAQMGKSSAQKGTPILYSNFRYYPACSFGEFCDLMADAYAIYGLKHPRHHKYMYSRVPDGKHKMPAGDVAAEAYRRWRVEQRVNRAQRVTVTPDVICLPASMRAPVDAFAVFVETLPIEDAPQVDRLAGLREFSGLCAWVAYATGQRLVDGWSVTMEHKNRHFATMEYRFVIWLNGEQVLVSNTGGLPDPRQPLVVDEVRVGDAAPDGAVQLALF